MTFKGNQVKVVSYNVNGLGNPIKRNKVIDKMKKEGVGVLFLQETHLKTKEHEKLKRSGFIQEFSASYKLGRRRGVSILISNKINFEQLKTLKDKEGRYVLVKGRLEGELVSLLNIYAPPGSDWGFYKHIFDLVSTQGEGILIGGGDLNQRLNPEMDTSGKTHQNNNTGRKISRLMHQMGLLDIWRDLNPTKRDYTYYSSPHSLYSRIDYFFIFKMDRYRIESCDIGTMDLSDHCPVYLNISMGGERKQTLWRLNSSLLNGQMREDIEKDIQEYLEQNDNGEVSPSVLWDACKAVIRGKLIARATYKKKMSQQRLKALQTEEGVAGGAHWVWIV